MLNFDGEGTLRSVETPADHTRLDALDRVEFYNGLLVPAAAGGPDEASLLARSGEGIEGGLSLEEALGRICPEGAFTTGRRWGVLLIEHIDWPRRSLTARSAVRRIL